MCGFVSAIALDCNARIDRSAVESAAALMRHRGPDSINFKHDAFFSFGHTRLNIVDANPRSNQPLMDVAGRVIVVFNGEIYNYRELRRELSARGSKFQTTSDTEVLVNAYIEWGDEMLSRLDGIFAFVIFDTRSNRAIAARDRLGVKPIYYRMRDDMIVLASEPKAIARAFATDITVDPATISAYLTFRDAIEPEQWDTGVRQLPPGHYLSISRGKVDVLRYWSLSDFEEAKTDQSNIASALGRAVRDQISADAPFGVLLSGGIDSSVLAREAFLESQKHPASSMRAYTASITDPHSDESAYAAEVAEYLNIPLAMVAVEPLISPDTLSTLTNFRDCPLGMHNEIAMYALARAVRSDAKILLCGEGADEGFGGYTRMFRLPFDAARARCFNRMPVVPREWMMNKFDIPPFSDANPMSLFFSRYGYFSQAEKAALMLPDVWRKIDGDSRLWTHVQERLSPVRDYPLFTQISYFFLVLHLPALLHMIDGVTMAASVEARVPFCDHRLIELALKLPHSLKLAWRSPLRHFAALFQRISEFSERADHGKVVIRDLYRGKLPPSVFARRKLGFPTPLRQWMWGQLRDLTYLMFERCSSPLWEYFDRRIIDDWLEQSRRGNDAPSRKLWMLMALGVFLQNRSSAAVY
jgi:asparagine synthase (glutamine-hydrolysing)